MNIRFSDQQIRFRMTKTELTDLLVGKSIQTKTIFPDNTSLNFYVNIGQQKSPAVLKRDKDIIMLYIEERQAKELEKEIPTKEGISLVLGKEAESPLKVVVEVDVLVKKRGQRKGVRHLFRKKDAQPNLQKLNANAQIMRVK